MCLAIPGKIISLAENKEGAMRMGKVEMGGIVKDINLQLVPDAGIADYVLVHVGVAISRVDEEEAQSTLRFLEQMNELDELYNAPPDGLSNEELLLKKDDIVAKMKA